jgi:hypothetical protein
MKNEIESEHAHFTAYFKMNDQFNLNRFLEKKKALRAKLGTDKIEEESISEKIGESLDYVASYGNQSKVLNSSAAPGRGAIMSQNFFGGANISRTDKDPLSLISIFAKRHTVNQTPEQTIPERERKSESRERKQ